MKGRGSPVDSDGGVGFVHKHGLGALKNYMQVGREAVLGCESMHEGGSRGEREKLTFQIV